MEKKENPARLQARLCSCTVLSSLTRTLLASPVASSTQVVNTDAGCVGMMGNVNWRNLASLLVSAGAVPPQSSLFALPSRGSAEQRPARRAKVTVGQEPDDFPLHMWFKMLMCIPLAFKTLISGIYNRGKKRLLKCGFKLKKAFGFIVLNKKNA